MFDLFTGTLALCTLGMLAVIVWSAVQNRMQPVRRVRAVVISRRTRDYGLSIPANPIYLILNVLGRGPGRPRISNEHLSRVSGEISVAETVTYLMRFGVEGDEIELVVPQSVFMSAQDGTQGQLVYQGEIFKHFMPDPVPDERTRRI